MSIYETHIIKCIDESYYTVKNKISGKYLNSKGLYQNDKAWFYKFDSVMNAFDKLTFNRKIENGAI